MEEKHRLFHSVHQLSRQLTKSLNEALEPFGLYNAQWAVLFVLKENGTLTQTELCEYLAVEAPPMTRTIQRLLKLGYVAQHTGHDKRKKYIKLTTSALEEFPNWETAVTEANQKLLKMIPESSQEELNVLLAKWLGNIKEEIR